MPTDQWPSSICSRADRRGSSQKPRNGPPTRPGESPYVPRFPGSDDRRRLDRHEVDLLPNAAVGAAPAIRDLRPGGPGREALALLAGHDLVGVGTPGTPPR